MSYQTDGIDIFSFKYHINYHMIFDNYHILINIIIDSL